jgi:hypothetical protein
MGRFAVGVLAVVLAGGGVAQAKEAKGANDTASWVAVAALKPGTKVVVEQMFTPGDYRAQPPCKVVRVDEQALTCSLGQRGQRIVYPADQVLTVYRVRMRVTVGSWARIVLYAGGGFLFGCAVTDENCDYPLGVIGGAAGGLAGVGNISRKPKFEVVYWRADTAAGGAGGQ